ncbi:MULTISPECIES: hypothetical protein [Stenotrophomonas]|jgi:hypothetical protein|uniref:hypothetical protein n=1 Tax=Stenotrophomonas TaxID=40323 RepID=UPI00201CDB7F|nr:MULTISPECIES: hypothetical protein [Stenotrophomonas]MBN5024559.1 hypothetical protein [Stenotrophomonas maltophilia]MDH1273423.1 hypothetical protein [Stenotrophomonas sp. GD03937]MDH1486235.1 hypothetical protein [Stenotrophomonas sp. GD03712]UQY96941.1 hypothetical protein LZ605_06145 [Stenotrophomonas maltophilia]WON70515.1 hypothetical protein RWT08_09375 [Stenotrophomonas maltophilia]
MQKLTSPRSSVFSYDPRWVEVRLGAESALYYMGSNSSFFVDQDPMGGRIQAPDADVLVDQPAGTLRLVSADRGEPVEYVVSAVSGFDHLILGLVSALLKAPGLTAGAADDKIDVACENGLIRACYITRVFEGDAPRSLRIVRKGEGVHVVIPSPRYQARITSLALDGSELLIDCDDGVTWGRMLSLPQPILGFFTEVVDNLREAAGG